jgi:hypothetical protein
LYPSNVAGKMFLSIKEVPFFVIIAVFLYRLALTVFFSLTVMN